MKLVIEYLADDIDSHAEEYNLGDNYTERTRVGHIVLTSIFLALKRAMNGVESKRIFGSIQISEGLGQQKKGLSKAIEGIWKQ